LELFELLGLLLGIFFEKLLELFELLGLGDGGRDGDGGREVVVELLFEFGIFFEKTLFESLGFELGRPPSCL